MCPHPIQEAIDEQAESAFPDKEADTKGRYRRARRSTEKILIEMADRIRVWEQWIPPKPKQQEPKKKQGRKRKRGPRVRTYSATPK